MAVIPVQRTWAIGEIVSASELNSNIRDAINFLLATPRCELTNSTSFTVGGNAVSVLVNFDTTLTDTDSMHPSSGARITANTAGLYECWAQIHFPFLNNAANSIGAGVFLTKDDGGTFTNQVVEANDFRRISQNSGLGTSSYVSKDIYLNVGDYVSLWGMQNTGSSMTTNGGGIFYIHLAAQWVAST